MLTRLALIDRQLYRLPDVYTLPLIIGGIGLNAALENGLPHQAIWGALLGYAIFWAIGALFYKLRGTEGLGLGDAKLFAAAGAWVGATYLPYVLLIASICPLIVALVRQRSRDTRIPFGPWIALGFWIVWLWRCAFDLV